MGGQNMAGKVETLTEERAAEMLAELGIVAGVLPDDIALPTFRRTRGGIAALAARALPETLYRLWYRDVQAWPLRAP